MNPWNLLPLLPTFLLLVAIGFVPNPRLRIAILGAVLLLIIAMATALTETGACT